VSEPIQNETIFSKIFSNWIYPVIFLLITAFVNYYFNAKDKEAQRAESIKAELAQAEDIKAQFKSQQNLLTREFGQQLDLIREKNSVDQENQELAFRQTEDLNELRNNQERLQLCRETVANNRLVKKEIYDELTRAIEKYQAAAFSTDVGVMLNDQVDLVSLQSRNIVTRRIIDKATAARDHLAFTLTKTVPFFGETTKKSVQRVRHAVDEISSVFYESINLKNELLGETKIPQEKMENLAILISRTIDSRKFWREEIDGLLISLANEIATGESVCSSQ
jgi:hypothetical protein